MKKIGVKILGILIAVIMVMQSTVSIAATKNQLNSNKTETEKKIDQTKEELNNIKSEKSTALKQVEDLTGQISEYENQIRVLENDMNNLNKQINEAETNLKQAENDYEKQQEMLETRLIAVYEGGETTYLDFLLSSQSLTDFLSHYYLVSEVAQMDAELLDKIQKQKDEIKQAKEKLEASKTELSNAKASKQQIANNLQASKKEKDSQVSKLNEEEKQTQAQLEQFEADKREIQNELALIAKKEAEERAKQNASGSGSSNVVVNTNPSAAGFIFPVAGLSKNNINNKNYPSYRGHTGIDVNINVHGKTIVAAKGGTVTRSKAYISNGSYYSYGECIVINHGGGLATLYAHGAPGSRKVQVGQTVSQGQALMTVGTTGNSSGEHLHFEVLVNGNPVNPLKYLP